MLCNHRVESGFGVDVGQSASAQRVKHCHFELSIESEKSKEFNTHFKFMDTSPKAQYDKIYDTKSVWYDKKK